MKIFIAGIVLLCLLIIEEYVTDKEFIQGNNNLVSGALSSFTININQDTTHDSTHKFVS